MAESSSTDTTQNLFAPRPEDQREYRLRLFRSSMNLLTHVLIGFVVGGALIFAFRNGVPITATRVHIVLCVLGYQLLMAQAIVSLNPYNTWSAQFRIVDKKRAHWILQILGSGLAIAGTFIKIADKTEHFTTLHGKFGLVALVFTTVCLVNGLASLWAYEIRRIIPIPIKLSKLTHICFGIVAFSMSSITLCYGFEKRFFRAQFGDGVAYTLIAFTACFTALILINPFVNFVFKIRRE